MTRLFGLWSDNLQRFLRDQHGVYGTADYRQAEYVKSQVISFNPQNAIVIKEFYPADPLSEADFITRTQDEGMPSIKANTYGK